MGEVRYAALVTRSLSWRCCVGTILVGRGAQYAINPSLLSKTVESLGLLCEALSCEERKALTRKSKSSITNILTPF